LHVFKLIFDHFSFQIYHSFPKDLKRKRKKEKKKKKKKEKTNKRLALQLRYGIR